MGSLDMADEDGWASGLPADGRYRLPRRFRAPQERTWNPPEPIEMDKEPTLESVKSDDGVHCAFFYGTLMVPGVFYNVCYNNSDPPKAFQDLHTFTPAIIHGYCRRRVKFADYPGIVEDNDHKVFGTFTTGLTKANLERLDFFEGPSYERRTVTVKLLDKVGDVHGHGQVEGEERKAEVYVYLNAAELEDREWDLEEFRREKLQNWTRQGYVFEDCDPGTTAKVAGEAW